MDLFNFISDEKFRASLETDYNEIELCIKAGAWKAVYVLAGSIVETLLLDYLVASEYEKRTNRKISNERFVDIITICKNEGVLNNKEADLANAIREYRNLIHPEKMSRLGETVNENGAMVAYALVKMVIDANSRHRSKQMGFTAEQMVTKIQSDPSSIVILEHFLKNMRDYEKKKLLIHVIPKTYISIKARLGLTDYFTNDVLKTLEQCFRIAFDISPIEARKDVALEFLRVLKEESTYTISLYEEVFFRGSDLEYFPPDGQQMFKSHFLSKFEKKVNRDLMRAIEGLGQYLTNEKDLNLFVDGYVRQILADDTSSPLAISAEEARRIFLGEVNKLSNDLKDVVQKRLNTWINQFEKSQQEHNLTIVKEVSEEVDNLFPFIDFPFFQEENVVIPDVNAGVEYYDGDSFLLVEDAGVDNDGDDPF